MPNTKEQRTNKKKTNNKLNLNTMKRLFLLLAVVALGLASCTEENFDNYNNSDSNKIGFNTMVGKNSMFKAYELDANTFEKFGVYAYKTDDGLLHDGLDPQAQANTVNNTVNTYIDHLIVNKSGGSWTYDGSPYFWPINDEKLQFFGYAGDYVQNWLPLKYENSQLTFPSFEYDVSELNAEDQKDLIIAYTPNQSKSINNNNSGQVKLNFKHILTQVNFSIKGENPDYYYYIEKIELKYVNKHGKFTFYDGVYGETPADAGNHTKFTEYGGKWEDQYNASNYVDYTYFDESSHGGMFTINKVNSGNSHEYISLGDGSDRDQSINNFKKRALMLIPQYPSTNNNTVISVTYKVKDATNQSVILSTTATAPLKYKDGDPNNDNNTPCWCPGIKIRYRLILPITSSGDAAKITFDAEVSSWDDEQTSDHTGTAQ